MSERLCESCPMNFDSRSEIAGRPIHEGFAILVDDRGGISKTLDLTKADFPNQVSTSALVRKVSECSGAVPAESEKSILRRIGEKIRIIKPKTVCPALGNLALAKNESITADVREELWNQAFGVGVIIGMTKNLTRQNKIRSIR